MFPSAALESTSQGVNVPMSLFRNARGSILAVLAVCAVLWGGQPAPRPPATTELTVSAAISLKDALDEIRSIYIAQHAGAAIAINYGAS